MNTSHRIDGAKFEEIKASGGGVATAIHVTYSLALISTLFDDHGQPVHEHVQATALGGPSAHTASAWVEPARRRLRRFEPPGERPDLAPLCVIHEGAGPVKSVRSWRFRGLCRF